MDSIMSAVRLYLKPLQPSVCGRISACEASRIKSSFKKITSMGLWVSIIHFPQKHSMYSLERLQKYRHPVCCCIVQSHFSYRLNDSPRIHQHLSLGSPPGLYITGRELDLLEASCYRRKKPANAKGLRKQNASIIKAKYRLIRENSALYFFFHKIQDICWTANWRIMFYYYLYPCIASDSDWV